MQIVIFNIPVEVIRKNIKNLHLSVLPPDGRVRVSAPTQLTDEAITMFVRTKLGWIKKQQEKFQLQPRQSERQYVSGETLYVWGKQYFLQVEYSYKGNALTLSGDKAIHSKTMNIFEYNYLGCNKFNKLNIRFYQLISLIVRISLSGHGKALTRRTSSN